MYDEATGTEALYAFNISTGAIQYTRPWPWATTGDTNPVVRIVARQPQTPMPFTPAAQTGFWAITRSPTLGFANNGTGNYGYVGLFRSDYGAPLLALTQVGNLTGVGPYGKGFTPNGRRTVAAAGLDPYTLYLTAGDLSGDGRSTPALIVPMMYNPVAGSIDYAPIAGASFPPPPLDSVPFLALATNGTIVMAAVGEGVNGGVIVCVQNSIPTPVRACCSDI